MKTTIVCLLLGALLTLGACAPRSDQDTAQDGSNRPEASVNSGNEASAALTPGTVESGNSLEDRLVVMDAMQYRGVVGELTDDQETLTLLLHRVDGTGYRFASLHAVTDEYTRANFEWNRIQEGDYLEVYYGDSLDGNPVTVIAANLLPDPALCVYNGELVLIERDGEGGGSLELRDRDSESHTVFHFDSGTQFYCDLDELEPGEMLNIFHSGATTRSIPPQGYALEVRLYSEH